MGWGVDDDAYDESSHPLLLAVHAQIILMFVPPLLGREVRVDIVRRANFEIEAIAA